MENKTKTKRPPRKRRSLSVAERKKQLHLRIGLSLAGIFLVFFLFLAPFGPHLLFGKGRAVNLSDSVLQYQALVDQYCEEYSIPAFSQVVLAIMQQESAGSVADVMQASESPFNTWALTNYGGYSQDNALEFAENMKGKLGWSQYGDPEYVSHVLRYYRS